MKRKITNWLLLGAILCTLNAGAQEHQPDKPPSWSAVFDLPPSVPVPGWVKKVDWQHPNVFRIDELLEKEERLGEEESEGSYEENELNEEPYRVAYIRWRRSMEPFVQSNGTVVYDSTYYLLQMQQATQAQPKVKLQTIAGTLNGTADWKILGPTEMWYPDNGGKNPWLANVTAFAIAPSNTSVLYCGTETGAIFKSTDKGLNWTSISDNLPQAGPIAIGVSPSDPNKVWVYANAMIYSADGGNTWTTLSGYTGGSCNQIIVNPNTGRIIAAGNTAAYYSDNNGTTWTLSAGSSTTGGMYDVMFNPANPSTVFAVGRSSAAGNPLIMLRSTDGGTNFSTITSGLAGINSSGARLAVTAADTSYVYCVTLDTNAPKILKSTDGGTTWTISATSTTTGLAGGNATTGLAMSNGQGYYDLVALASPLDKNALIVGTTSAYKSTDGGVNFSPIGGYNGPYQLHPDFQWAAAIGSDAYLTTDGGVNYSTDFFSTSANWSVRSNGITGSDFWGFDQGWDQDIVVGGRYHNGNVALYDSYGAGPGLRLGGGESATGHVFHGSANTVGLNDLGSNKILPNSFTGSLINSGITNQIFPSTNNNGEFSAKLVVDSRYSNIIYVTKDSTLWKSVNKGASYTALHNFGSKAWRFVIARSNPGIIYLCATSGIYKSIDTGTTWSQLSLPGGVTYQYYYTDVAVNPANENEVYFCMGQGTAANKVFKSTNGGTSWTNYTGTALNNKSVAFLQYQGGTNGGVYAITNASPTQVFYRDNTMSDWTNFSTGIPKNFKAREGGLIFYRDSKLRLAGNRGIWESPLYGPSTPVAQPLADKRAISCSKDTIHFMDYSIEDYDGATVSWGFPGASYISCTNCRYPNVLYPGPGSYDVSLTVTDNLGNSNTKTENDMIFFDADNCAPDTVAGKSLYMNGSTTNISIGTVPINSNNFSISCWIRPYGNQGSFSQIISHPPYNSSFGFGMGFTFNSYNPNLKLCYTDDMVTYYNNSGLVADSTKWNFVVLTYSPTGVKMYLNGKSATANNSAMPVIDLSKTPFYVNYDAAGQGSRYKGEVDEIKFYNYALSQDEVRSKMHLIQNPALAETGLLKYIQFNQYNPATSTVYDVAGGYNCTIPNASYIVNSTAPVATGVVKKLTSVNAGGQYSFTGTGIDMFLKSSAATYPNGDMYGFRLYSYPDQLPDARPIVQDRNYFVINNYGTNATITAPDSIRFSSLIMNGSTPYTAGNFRMFKRPSGAFGNTWGTELDSADNYVYNTSGAITFGAGNNVTSFSQFTIVDNYTPTPLAVNVDFLHFTATGIKNKITLDWKVRMEHDLDYYQLERSSDGRQFEPLTKVMAKPAASVNSYAYDDYNVRTNTRYYYRINCMGKDGSKMYSPVRNAILWSDGAFVVYPNPASGLLHVELSAVTDNRQLHISVFDVAGKCVYQVNQAVQGNTPLHMMLNLSALPSGTYILHAQTDGGQAYEEKIVLR